MIIPVAALLLILSAALAGGRLTRLAAVRLRWLPVIVLALLAQVVVLQAPVGDGPVAAGVHLASYIAAAAFIWANRRVPGLLVIAVGAASNGIAIAANGGVLPASASALTSAGITQAERTFVNSGVLDHPRLAFLGDVFAVPAGVPLANVFSVGDVIIVLGAGLAAYRICGTFWWSPWDAGTHGHGFRERGRHRAGGTVPAGPADPDPVTPTAAPAPLAIAPAAPDAASDAAQGTAPRDPAAQDTAAQDTSAQDTSPQDPATGTTAAPSVPSRRDRRRTDRVVTVPPAGAAATQADPPGQPSASSRRSRRLGPAARDRGRRAARVPVPTPPPAPIPAQQLPPIPAQQLPPIPAQQLPPVPTPPPAPIPTQQLPPVPTPPPAPIPAQQLPPVPQQPAPPAVPVGHPFPPAPRHGESRPAGPAVIAPAPAPAPAPVAPSAPTGLAALFPERAPAGTATIPTAPQGHTMPVAVDVVARKRSRIPWPRQRPTGETTPTVSEPSGPPPSEAPGQPGPMMWAPGAAVPTPGGAPLDAVPPTGPAPIDVQVEPAGAEPARLTFPVQPVALTITPHRGRLGPRFRSR